MSRAALLAATAGLALASLSAFAADTYVVDPTHTFPRFAVSHFGFSTFHGRFERTSGQVTLDLAKKSGSADITIETASVSTGVEKLDEHLRKPDFFDAEKYPAIRFKSQDFRFAGDTLKEVHGELSLHGVTRPVTLAVTGFACKEHPLKKVQACGADASVTIRRSDFGMSTYVPNIGDEVQIGIEIEAHRQ